MAWWQRYWFAPSYYLDLAVLRISAATVQLLIWLGWLPGRSMYD
jgi:hypothetical protein